MVAGIGLGVGAATGTMAVVDAVRGSHTRLPDRVAAVYWTNWNQRIRLREIPSTYNVLHLFAATPLGDHGNISWNRPGIADDLAICRARGQRVLLSVGGAGQAIDFASRSVAARFVESVASIDAELGGRPGLRALDGLDLNTFESETDPNVVEYMWIAEQLKRRFGEDFLLTCPPSPRSERDQRFCQALLAVGAMDYVSPQYYDGPGLSDPRYIIEQTERWVAEVAAGDARRIGVGFGMEGLPYYSSFAEILQAWTGIVDAHPDIRGAFLWQHSTDAERGWPFARRAAPLISPVAPPM